MKKSKTRQPPTSTKDPVTQWARDVHDGKIVAGPHVRNAARRHLDDLKEGPSRALVWDLDDAIRVINFFPSVLRLSETFHGVPFELQPFQKFIIGSIFGWKRSGGSRRFRRAFIEIGKGNGKSPVAAGLGLYCLFADKEPQAQVYSAASMKSQARVVFDYAVRMWRQSPLLLGNLHPSGETLIHNLAHLKSGSWFRPVSADEGRFSGPIPSCAICDEVHEHRDNSIIEMLERGFKNRLQPLMFMITNSGSDKSSVCWDQHCHAVRCAAGQREAEKDPAYVGEVIDDTTFAFVCGLDLGDDPLSDESCWQKANPLLEGEGRAQQLLREELVRAAKKARDMPGSLNLILRLNFCEWTDAETAWMSRELLQKCLVDFEPETEHAGEDVFLGLDLSASKDLSALGYCAPTGLVERVNEDGSKVMLPTYDVWVDAWTPKDTMGQRALQDQAPYDLWAQDEWLTPVPGKIIRMDYLAARVAEVSSVYNVQSLAYDNWGFQAGFVPALDEFGIDIKITPHPQAGKNARAGSTLTMPGSKRAFEELILDGRVRIQNNPVLISAIMSAAIMPDKMDNTSFSKQKATQRIDALIAVTMAVGAATAVLSRSIYDDPAAYMRAFGRDHDPAGMNPVGEQATAALQYVGNAGNAGNAATVAGFDENFDPVGPALRKELIPRYMLDLAGTLVLTREGERAQSPIDQGDADRTDFDPNIIADPVHPMFQIHKARFQRWQEQQFDEE